MSNSIELSALDFNKIEKSSNNFTVLEELLNEINNIEYTNNFISENTNQYIGLSKSLSAISDIIGEKIYADILNYIDNIGNVDICKIKSLQSMINILGLEYQLLDSVNQMPLEIQNVINIFSITPEYLLNSNKINKHLIEFLKENNVIEEPHINDDNKLANVEYSHILNIEKIDNICKEIYKKIILDALEHTYYDQKSSETNIATLNSTYVNYINNDHNIVVRSEYFQKKIDKLYSELNIPKSFNVSEETDNIDNGISSYNDYNIFQQQLIDAELEYRKAPYDASKLYTSYSYYRESYVQKYISFVEVLYSTINITNNLSNINIYELDNQYIYLTQNNANNILIKNSDNNKIEINHNIINEILDYLLLITRQIRDIRQQIKTSAQRIYMKGTWLFVTYVINEYLKANINPIIYKDNTSKLNTNADIQLIEYIDPVEYMNISTDIDDKYGLSSTNYPYWKKNVNISIIKPQNTTNILQKLPTIDFEGFSFSQQELANFYINVLNTKFTDNKFVNFTSSDNEHLYTFLCTLFEYGADRTCVKNNEVVTQLNHTSNYMTYDYIVETELYKQQLSSNINNQNIYVKNLDDIITDKLSNAYLYELDSLNTLSNGCVNLINFNTHISDTQISVNSTYNQLLKILEQNMLVATDVDLSCINLLKTFISNLSSEVQLLREQSQRFDQYITTFTSMQTQISQKIGYLGNAEFSKTANDKRLGLFIQMLNEEYGNVLSSQINSCISIEDAIVPFFQISYYNFNNIINNFSQISSNFINPDNFQTYYMDIYSELSNLCDTYTNGLSVFNVRNIDQITCGSARKYIETKFANPFYDDIEYTTIANFDVKTSKPTSKSDEGSQFANVLEATVNDIDSSLNTAKNIIKIIINIHSNIKSIIERIINLIQNLNDLLFGEDKLLLKFKNQYYQGKNKLLLQYLKSKIDIAYIYVEKLTDINNTKFSNQQLSNETLISSIKDKYNYLLSAEVDFPTNILEYFDMISSDILDTENIIEISEYDKNKQKFIELSTTFINTIVNQDTEYDQFNNLIYEYNNERINILNNFNTTIKQLNLSQTSLSDIQWYIENLENSNELQYEYSNMVQILNTFEDNIIKLSSDEFENRSIPSLWNDTVNYTVEHSIKDFTQNSNNYLSITNINLECLNKIIELKNQKIDIQKSDFSQHKEALFYKYTGNISGEIPFYYIKNSDHPSYTIHPYLSNFIEAVDFSYSIENMPQLTENLMYDLISENIDNYIDDMGYVVSAWNNPLNSNSEYLTLYEKSNHSDELNSANPLVGYDGLFYPKALDEYLTIDINNDTDLNNFIQKWYKGLNLSNNNLRRIKDQLKHFYIEIKNIAKDNYYDIYRYAKDIYGNIYLLLKNYGCTNINQMKSVLESTKNTTPGNLWIRIKNHPLAFPAYYFSKQLTDNNDTEIDKYITHCNIIWDELSQIFYDDKNSNTVCSWMRQLYNIEKFNQLNTNNIKSMPLFYDFYISSDKTTLLLYGKRVFSSYLKSTLMAKKHNPLIPVVLINKISQKYNYDIQYDRSLLQLNSINKIEQIELREFDQDANKIKNDTFKCFFTYDTRYPGFITLEKIDNDIENTINIKSYIIKNDENIIHTISKKLTLSTNNIDSIVIDTYKNNFTLAYLSVDENLNKELKTYFNNETVENYNGLCEYLNTSTKSLIVYEGLISDNFITYDSNFKKYIPFVDMGFIPAISYHLLNDDNKINEFNDSIYMNKFNVFKIQLIGNNISDNNKPKQGIDFQPITLNNLRRYEIKNVIKLNNLDNIYYTGHNNELSVESYTDIHYYENTFKLNFNEPIYSPSNLKKYGINTYKFLAKINELTDTNERDIYQLILKDEYRVIPFICTNNKGDIPKHYITPGKTDGHDEQYKVNISDNNNKQTLFKITDDTTLSVTWCKYNNNTIKLDFNAQYFNEQLNPNCPNYYNYQHTFLNLDYPGAAGYLKVYKPEVSNITSGWEFDEGFIQNIFYIKNVSDNVPKFIISAMYNVNVQTELTTFKTDENSFFAIDINSSDDDYIKYITLLNL